ncbi:hypothetical protein SOM37_24880 [Bacillus thuringiensis]|uniref:hypothetical protein n=1 Tax=Bacillus thuringiensis TaxID=1428 RepID=UPI002A6AC3EB|nr:hypothetical protein [Bacillus thuringiensis]MDY0952078.1 hypothetical protein [Bacillus thuringiensis]
MNINEILSKSKKFVDESINVIHFNGVIDKDTNEDYFRIYPDPRNKKHYLRVKKDDIDGEIHEYTTDNLKDAKLIPALGLTPHNEFILHQVPVKHGVEIDCISVEKAKVGIEYPQPFAKLFSDKPIKECTCDQHKKKEQLEFYEGASCLTSSVCTSGCQWCPSLVGEPCHCNDWCPCR